MLSAQRGARSSKSERSFAHRLLSVPHLDDCAASWPYSALRTAEPESGADGGLNDLCCCQGLARAEKPPPVAAGDAALMADGKVSGQTSARALERQTSPSTIFSARWGSLYL